MKTIPSIRIRVAFAVLACMAGAAQSRAESAMGPMTNGLVSYYPMHGDAQDASGRGMNGTLTGSPMMTTNRFGRSMGAMAFNGGMDGMMMTNLPVGMATNMQNSVSFWMNRSAQPGGSALSMPFGWGNTNQPLCLLFDGSDGDRFGFSGGRGGGYGMGSGMMPTNTWMHIAAVFNNGTMSGSQLYVDGQPMMGMMSMSATQGGMMGSGSAASMAFVGGAGGTPSGANPFFGMMSDLRVYDRALTGDEIMGLYRMEAGAEVRLMPGAAPGTMRMEIGSMMAGWMFQVQSSTDLVHWMDQGDMLKPGAQGSNSVAVGMDGPAMFWRTMGRP